MRRKNRLTNRKTPIVRRSKRRTKKETDRRRRHLFSVFIHRHKKDAIKERD
jgi:hypothetical protein